MALIRDQLKKIIILLLKPFLLKWLYSKYVNNIIENLEYALEYTENENQHESIKTLIQFYKTGDAKDFDTHCVKFGQKDKDSSICFVNGLIESYEDYC